MSHQLERRGDGLRVARMTTLRASDRILTSAATTETARTARLRSGAHRVLVQEEHQMQRRSQVLRAYDPRRQMERGWSLARDNAGRVVRSVSNLGIGDELTTKFVDGEVASRVGSIALSKPSGDTSEGEDQ